MLQEEVEEFALFHPGLLLLRVGFAYGGGQASLVGGVRRAIMEELGELVGRAVEGEAGRERLAERDRSRVLRDGHVLVAREAGGLQQGGHGLRVVSREDPEAVAALVGETAAGEGDREVPGVLLAGRGAEATAVDQAGRERVVLVEGRGHESTPQDA